jgi:RNA polymerase sigma-70 factor (ECF subfamily)
MSQEFIKAAMAGDVSAWNILYRQHAPWLYATALGICGNSPEAKDAVQDTLIQAYLKLQQLKTPNAFTAWLKKMLFRNCIRYRQSKHPTNSFTSFETIDAAQKVVEDEINGKLELYAQQIKVYNTLGFLSEPLQSVVLLRYFSAWQSYEQIAKVLCIPTGTVRSRLSEARQKMAEYWKRNNADNEKPFRQAEEWNHFYSLRFETIHSSLSSREKLLHHLDKNLQLVFTSGNTVYGRHYIQKEIEDDLLHGSSFGEVQVTSSGSLSIVEVGNINSAEYPYRCPDSGIFVLYRNKNKVTRFNFHNSK